VRRPRRVSYRFGGRLVDGLLCRRLGGFDGLLCGLRHGNHGSRLHHQVMLLRHYGARTDDDVLHDLFLGDCRGGRTTCGEGDTGEDRSGGHEASGYAEALTERDTTAKH